MSSTANLALPLVAAAQAQKHVTVNEAFERIDASGYGRCLAEWFDRGFDIDIITRRVREATR